MAKFPTLIHCKKSISYFPAWSAPEPETGFMYFLAPLEIDGIVQDAFHLFGSCCAHYPDSHVCFELVLSKTPTRRRTVLERIDWRSLQGGHSNKRKRPDGVPRRTKATHWHKFELNYNKSSDRMIGDNLPIAQNIDKPIKSFETLRDFVGTRFNIDNPDVVSAPEWEYNLFYGVRQFPDDE